MVVLWPNWARWPALAVSGKGGVELGVSQCAGVCRGHPEGSRKMQQVPSAFALWSLRGHGLETSSPTGPNPMGSVLRDDVTFHSS